MAGRLNDADIIWTNVRQFSYKEYAYKNYEYVLVTVPLTEHRFRLYRQDFKRVQRLIERVGYVFKGGALGVISCEPRYSLINEGAVKRRRLARSRVFGLRRDIEHARREVNAYGSKPIYAIPEVIEAIVADVREWPEVCDVAFDGESYFDYEYGERHTDPGELFVRFWPVYWPAYAGLTPPMGFIIDGYGDVTILEDGRAAMPHINEDNEACWGQAEIGQGEGMPKSLVMLRAWMVASDGGPLDDWGGRAHDWWNENKYTFFDQYQEHARYIEATNDGYDEDEEAGTYPLKPSDIDRMLPTSRKTKCSRCAYQYDPNNSGFTCDSCEDALCDDHYGSDGECDRCYDERIREEEEEKEREREEEEEERERERLEQGEPPELSGAALPGQEGLF